MTTQSLTSRVDDLLAALADNDLFARQSSHDKFRGLGLDAIPILLTGADTGGPSVALALREVVVGLPTEDRERACADLTRALRRGNSHPRRTLALATIGDCLHDLVSYVDSVLPIVLDPNEPSDLRVRALNVLRDAPLILSQGRDLVDFLKLAELTEAAHTDFRAAVFACLGKHADKLPVKTTMDLLSPFLTHPTPEIRVHALGLLGSVGDLDAIERMCLLPNTAEEIRHIQESIGRILLRPTNLLALRPEHFEHFIAHLLRKMDVEDVEHTGASHDGGVDVMGNYRRTNAMGPARERWVVQCKRWATKPVDLPDVEKLIATSRERNAKHAIMITTSDFTARARAFAKENDSAVELISGTKLLELLDEHLGSGRYTIRPHD